ncbi:hypothetical protein Acr_20g0011250 [Actinidia rufa]|uniref:Retrotransposon gag domain-containing protein n=1 Tax=Actinidia rufa TaxID=165716 RepID=A0A7J0GET2_9ERIC|nr:hypothetical protein Acr_20g0011250 [Actinidia rufa]
MHLRIRNLPRPSASSPLDNRAPPMANASQAPDLEGLHHEIHGMPEQMRVMNENNARLIQLLAAANPQPQQQHHPSLMSSDLATLIVRGIVLTTSVPNERGVGAEHQVRPYVKGVPLQNLVKLDPEQTDPPFTEKVLGARISSKFKLPTQLGIYEGKTDPMDHLDSYKILMPLQGCSDEVMCKAFSATLKGPARSWFRKLSPGTIDSFGELSRLFVANFMSCRNRQKNASHLFTIHQKETESLKDFVKRFNQAILEVEDPSDKSKADKYIAAEELAEAKRRRRGKDDHKRKEPDTRRNDYREKQGIKDLIEILNARTIGVLAHHLAAPNLFYRHSTPLLPKRNQGDHFYLPPENEIPTLTGIGKVKGDQKVARQCFISAMKTPFPPESYLYMETTPYEILSFTTPTITGYSPDGNLSDCLLYLRDLLPYLSFRGSHHDPWARPITPSMKRPLPHLTKGEGWTDLVPITLLRLALLVAPFAVELVLDLVRDPFLALTRVPRLDLLALALTLVPRLDLLTLALTREPRLDLLALALTRLPPA